MVFTVRNNVATMGFLTGKRIEYGGVVYCKKKIEESVKIMNNLGFAGSISLCYLARPPAKIDVVIAWSFRLCVILSDHWFLICRFVEAEFAECKRNCVGLLLAEDASW